MYGFSLSSFAAGTAIGIMLAGIWLAGNISTIFPKSIPVGAASSSAPVSSDSGAISIADQSAGDSVIIDSVTVPRPGVWVAVRELDGQDLGNVLGAIKTSGPRSALTVPLLRATVPGRTYAVELYRDDGSGTFDPNFSVYVDFDTGERVVAYFKTTP